MLLQLLLQLGMECQIIALEIEICVHVIGTSLLLLLTYLHIAFNEPINGLQS